MKRSAGILLFRGAKPNIEVFLVHPGGPYWTRKDAGAWTIPKGEYVEGEEALDAAKREFQEETGFPAEGTFLPLGEVRQASGKRVTAWALEGDLDASAIHSNTFELEWPPRSGRMAEFPEVDAGAWFTVEAAKAKLHTAQIAFLDRLMDLIYSPIND